MIDINAEPQSEPTTIPSPRPAFPVEGSRKTKLRVQTQIIPPTAIQGIKRYGIL